MKTDNSKITRRSIKAPLQVNPTARTISIIGVLCFSNWTVARRLIDGCATQPKPSQQTQILWGEVNMRHTVLFYNPISTSRGKQRLPLSLLSVAAVIADDYDIEFIDGNLIDDPAQAIIDRAKATGAKLLACTVMPGPQLRQAVPVCKRVKAALPDLTILWGGYFPTQHGEVILRSDCVDYIIQGQGEAPFRTFVDTLHHGGAM